MNAPKPPYRSKSRDIRKFIVDDLPKFSAFMRGEAYEEPPRRPDDLLLHQTAGRLSQIIKDAARFNRRQLQSLIGERATPVEDCIDDVWTVLGKYMPVIYRIGDAQPHPANEVIFACVVRSALNLYTSHSLTMSGLFGPARPLLRLVFEALMIAKYCAT
jgi:hypothetical protein